MPRSRRSGKALPKNKLKGHTICMKKILVLLEDFNRNNAISGNLKRVGWDVLSSQNEVGFAEKILSFSPDIVLLDAKSRKVQGLKLVAELAKKPKACKSILVFSDEKSARENLQNAKLANAILVEPFSYAHLFKVLESFGGISALDSMEKLKNLGVLEEKEQFIVVKSDTNPSVKESSQFIKEQNVVAKEKFAKISNLEEHNKKRHDKYLKLTENIKSDFSGFPPEQIKNELKYYRENEDSAEVKAIDEERKAFVVELFKNAKK